MSDNPEWTEAQRCGYSTALWLVQQGYMDDAHMEAAAKGIEANFGRAIKTERDTCATLIEGHEELGEARLVLAAQIRNRPE